MRAVIGVVALVAAVVAVGLSGYVTNTLIPLASASRIMDTNSGLSLTSSAFSDGGSIPPQFTCDGNEVSPPISIADVPEGTKSLALIMDDPDIPQQFKDQMRVDAYAHWILFNMSPDTTDIPTGGLAGTPGANSAGQNAYAAPCPPPQYEPSTHRYVFSLYALDTTLLLNPGASKADVESAMRGHIVAQTRLVGLYGRK